MYYIKLYVKSKFIDSMETCQSALYPYNVPTFYLFVQQCFICVNMITLRLKKVYLESFVF